MVLRKVNCEGGPLCSLDTCTCQFVVRDPCSGNELINILRKVSGHSASLDTFTCQLKGRDPCPVNELINILRKVSGEGGHSASLDTFTRL